MPESPMDKSVLTETRLPLNGITVLDLTLARAGPPVRPRTTTGSRNAAAMPPAIRPNSSYVTLAEPSTASTRARSTASMAIFKPIRAAAAPRNPVNQDRTA